MKEPEPTSGFRKILILTIPGAAAWLIPICYGLAKNYAPELVTMASAAGLTWYWPANLAPAFLLATASSLYAVVEGSRFPPTVSVVLLGMLNLSISVFSPFAVLVVLWMAFF